MTEEKELFTIGIADYIIGHDCTIRQAAEHFHIGTNHVSYVIWHYLRDIDEDKFNLIREGFKRHKADKQSRRKYIWKDIDTLKTDGAYLFKLEDGTCCFGMHYNGINYKEGDLPILFYMPAEYFVPKKLK